MHRLTHVPREQRERVSSYNDLCANSNTSIMFGQIFPSLLEVDLRSGRNTSSLTCTFMRPLRFGGKQAVCPVIATP